MLVWFRSLLALVALWLMAAGAQAELRVVIVSSDSTAAYADAAKALTDSLGLAGVKRAGIWQMSVTEWNAADAEVTALNPQAFVALGTEAATSLARARLKAPVLCALMPRSSFERVLRETGRRASSQFNVLYLDQSLQRQLALIRLALPQARRVGILWGPDSWTRAPALRALARANGLLVQEARLEASSSLFSVLQPVLENSDVMLALADPLVFNSSSIQNILMTTIRYKVPLVAFSPAYVRAGAMLALYSTPAQAGAQAAQWTLGVLANRALPEPALEPLDFEVSVNEQVARALGLSFDVKALTLALKREEQQP
jgi:putative tryptophan/tyrosine transport system substrate-binding protein